MSKAIAEWFKGVHPRKYGAHFPPYDSHLYFGSNASLQGYYVCNYCFGEGTRAAALAHLLSGEAITHDHMDWDILNEPPF